ncbi:M48 family metalloprotease [Paraburkholderia sp. J8-2]|uniref:M48 family metalloprotease n=1 Tax=Paraburkholderia sp. J8-2 TaxID=2805440 RepID=UPI002AB667B7|nr:M48 family metalloprotease [Paraburkholderia sp. J8-2]
MNRTFRSCMASIACSVVLTSPAALAHTVGVAALSDRFSQDYARDMDSAIEGIAVPEGSPQYSRALGIVGKLSAALGQPRWRVIVFQKAKMPRGLDVPAFALPDRQIAVSDWDVSVWSDDTLAFVLAHEMGHVELGHQSQVWQTIMERTGLHPGTWAELSKYAGAAKSLLRAQEYEADRFGFALAQQGGFDAAQGARALFRNLGRDDMHPSPLSREAALGIWP